MYALNRLHGMGKLGALRVPVAIGQGWKGETGEIGVGSCTGAFRRSLRGCPPSGGEILRFLLDEAMDEGCGKGT